MKKELYILEDLNKSLYQNGNYAGCKNNIFVSNTIPNDVKNYHQLCTMFGLTQLVKRPTCITSVNV